MNPDPKIPETETRIQEPGIRNPKSKTAQQVFQERGDTVEYRVGTMIEIPRAALLAGEIAKVPQPENLNPKPETRTLKICDQNPETQTRNPKSEPETRNPNP